MLILIGELTDSDYTKVNFQLWDTDTKECLDEEVVPFGTLEELLARWHAKHTFLVPVYIFNHGGGFKEVFNPKKV